MTLPAIVANPPVMTACISDFVKCGNIGRIASGASACTVQYRHCTVYSHRITETAVVNANLNCSHESYNIFRPARIQLYNVCNAEAVQRGS